MTTEDYCSFEVAKLLKEKGFDEDIDLWYDESGEMFSCHKYGISGDWRVKAQQEVYLCPTLQMAMKWLREVHHLWIDIDLLTGYEWTWSIWFMNDPELKMGESSQVISTYNEACEAAIEYCLTNLI